MPASMINAPSGESVNVIGSSMAMVAVGPTPGSTPISVPSNTPTRNMTRLNCTSAPTTPSPRLPRISMPVLSDEGRPDREGQRERAHEGEHGTDGQHDGEDRDLLPPELRTAERAHDDRDHRGDDEP